MHIITAEKVQPIESVGGHQSFDFVEECQRIKRAQLWLQTVRREPDSMPVRFAGLRTARLSQIGCHSALAEGNERLDVGTHAAGEANKDFEVGFHACAIRSLSCQLQIAEGVGHGTGLLIETRGREDHVGCRAVSVRKIS